MSVAKYGSLRGDDIEMSYYDRHENDGTGFVVFVCFFGIFIIIIASVLLWGY